MKPNCDCPKYETRITYTKCSHWVPFGPGLIGKVLRRIFCG